LAARSDRFDPKFGDNAESLGIFENWLYRTPHHCGAMLVPQIGPL
jgi:hypothetical protein